MGNLPDKPHRAALMAFQQSGNLFPERLPRAVPSRADQPPDAQADNDLAAIDRHILHRPPVIRVHLRRRSPADRARHGPIPSAGRDHHHAAALRHVLDNQR
jgi:hypothetical protein